MESILGIKKETTIDKIILDLCGGSGSWSYPYKQAGYDVRLITLPDNDVRYYEPPASVYGILAAPPCTEFSIAKAKWIRNPEIGMEIVEACMRIIEACKPVFWALENPSGWLSQFIGKPIFSFQPWQYGNPWTKRTMIWGNFHIPPPLYSSYADVPKIDGLYQRPGRATASLAFNHVGHKKLIRAFDPFEANTDADFRAITPPGFAQAFFNSNH
jgi:hypothetical protein